MIKEKFFSRLVKDCANSALTTIYFMFAYFVSCLLLNFIIPHLIPTERAAQQFWIFGVAAIVICGGGFALLKATCRQPSNLAIVRVFRALGIMCEALVFISAIAIFIEGIRYDAWVEQFEIITAQSGTDVRFWIAGILFTDGVFGNLLAASLTA